jgi:fusion and transport protein UGO1
LFYWLLNTSGFTTSVLSSTLTHYLPPLLQTILIPLFTTSHSSLRHSPPTLLSSPTPLLTLLPYIASHSLAGFLLSPLDLLNTRLIVQAAPSRRRGNPIKTYSANPLVSLPKIAREEGGWWSTYFHPTVFWPTIWDLTLRSLVSLATPILIEQTFHVSLVNSPMSYRTLEAVLNIAGLLITLPIETARRRMQVQSRSPTSREGFKTCVDVRGRPYVGLVECIWRIATEEDGGSSGGRFGGVKQLYRGFGLNLVASSAVLALESVILATGTERGAGGWREI